MKFLTITAKKKGLNLLRATTNRDHNPKEDALEILNWLSIVLPGETLHALHHLLFTTIETEDFEIEQAAGKFRE